MIVGLTGGLAAGKSFVAAELRKLGCVVVEADDLGHEVLKPGGEVYDAVRREFGTAGRRELAKIVFSDPAKLARLNAIVHPAVRERAQAEFAKHPGEIVVYVAAILIESGGYKDMEKLIVLRCTREQQIARALERPGATIEDVLARLARQLPLEKKLPCADYIVDTGGTKEETVSQIRMVVEDLKK